MHSPLSASPPTPTSSHISNPIIPPSFKSHPRLCSVPSAYPHSGIRSTIGGAPSFIRLHRSRTVVVPAVTLDTYQKTHKLESLVTTADYHMIHIDRVP